MPEAIEVKTYADFITKYIKGKNITDIRILNGRYKKHGPFNEYAVLVAQLPLKVVSIQNKGKYLYIELGNGTYIGVTLGLTGGWFWKGKGKGKLLHGLDQRSNRYSPEMVDSYVQNAMKHLNVAFEFDQGTLFFYDQLSFGTISVLGVKENETKLAKIGEDVLGDNFNLTEFIVAFEKIKNKDRYIGNVLMDQHVISGVGNYLRADALWMSKLSPFRRIKNITKDELEILFVNVRKLVWGIYNNRRARIRGHIEADDKMPMDYGRDFFVYMNDMDIYGNKITKEKLYEGSQIRYIYWTKGHQK